MTTIRLDSPCLEITFCQDIRKNYPEVTFGIINEEKGIICRALDNSVNTRPFKSMSLQKPEALKLIEFLKSIYEVEDER